MLTLEAAMLAVEAAKPRAVMTTTAIVMVPCNLLGMEMGGDGEEDVKEGVGSGDDMSVSRGSSRSRSVSPSSTLSSSTSHRLFAALLVHLTGGGAEKGDVSTTAVSLSGSDVEETKVGC